MISKEGIRISPNWIDCECGEALFIEVHDGMTTALCPTCGKTNQMVTGWRVPG